MNKKKILVVDDERIARKKILTFLDPIKDQFEIYEAENGITALELIYQHKPDIVFLDIAMPLLNGFDILRSAEPRSFQVVFQTGYDEFAIKAFEVNACDYLLKPFSKERFMIALNKALQKTSADTSIDALEKHLIEEKKYLEKIVITTGSRSLIFSVTDVLYFQSEEHKTRVFFQSINYWYDHSLKFLEQSLSPEKFLRIHRNTLIALDGISSIVWKNPITLIMKNGQNLTVAKDRSSAVRKILKS